MVPLAVAMRAEFDEPTWLVYYRALSDVPLPLLAAAVLTLVRSDRPMMPRPGEIRAAAESERMALLARYPYQGCIDCEDQIGWRTVTINGRRFAERCPCRDRYAAKLQAMGVGPPLLLPAGDEVEV